MNNTQTNNIGFGIEQFLEKNENRELLRISTAGSIDDGKSTLIGRLLHDSKGVFEDQLESVKNASNKINEHADIDYALITDGLKSEREQGITIDVAYRYFSTPKRKFIIADTPGHEQYTRNMATGASTADVAVILIDARNGILPQTKRHSFISSLLEVPHMVIVINKMDLVDYSQDRFEQIKNEFSSFAQKLNIHDLRFIPMSALKGENVIENSEKMPWYKGESFLNYLENIHIASDINYIDLRYPVQQVIRPNQDFRGYASQIVSGIIRQGDEILTLPSMKTSKVKSIDTFDGNLKEAYAPMSVTVSLEDELDISRGDMLVHKRNVPHVERHFEAMCVWMGDKPMDTNRQYYIKHTTQSIKARIEEVQYKVDVNNLSRLESSNLELNEIGRVVFTSMKPIYYDPYDKNRYTGSFILVDSLTNNTVGACMILDREPEAMLPAKGSSETGITYQARGSLISTQERESKTKQRGHTIWLTGLVSVGKTEIAYDLEKKLFDAGFNCVVLDGENMRLGLSKDLEFGALDRAEHLRRVAEVAKTLNDSGIIAICAFVSPFKKSRQLACDITGKNKFSEIYLAADLDFCRARDKTGLYEKASKGEIQNFAGVDLPYEKPENPALIIDRIKTDETKASEMLFEYLREKSIISNH